jgi:hypothetical protein
VVGTVSKREPDWDVDRLRGEEAEAIWRKTRTWMANGTAEVKRDDKAHETGCIYVEYECLWADGKWHPSGIKTTKAHLWVFFVQPVIIALPVSVLKNVSREAWRKPRGKVELSRGSHPTRGVRVPLNMLVARAIEGWHAPIGGVGAYELDDAA